MISFRLFYTLESEKHKLVHVGLYGTMQTPKPRPKDGSRKKHFFLHLACAKRVQRGLYKLLGARSKRFPTCVKCARWPKYPRC